MSTVSRSDRRNGQQQQRARTRSSGSGGSSAASSPDHSPTTKSRHNTMHTPPCTTTTTSSSSPPSSPVPKNTICMEHRRNTRPSLISPSSPSRSWEDGEAQQRPPSPNCPSTRKTQPRQQQVFRRVVAYTSESQPDVESILRRRSKSGDEADAELEASWQRQPQRSESPSSVSSEPIQSLQQQSILLQPRGDTVWDSTSTSEPAFAIASVDVAAEPQRTSPLGVPTSPSHDTTPSLVTTESSSHLEHKNGTVEGKRKVADAEIQRLTHELRVSQKQRQALATELRDVQTAAAASAGTTSTSTSLDNEQQQQQRLRLSGRLEANLTQVRSAIVVLEATQDAAAVAHVTELLHDSAEALREGIAVPQIVQQSDSDPYRVFRELELQTKRVRGLEVSLQEQEEEYRTFRTQTQREQMLREEENNALVAEIRILRQQCTTNMEVLTKKERELAVLRDSLRVEDDVGYISDDEDEEEVAAAEHHRTATPPADPSLRISSPTQMEALATLLATGGNRSFESGIETNSGPLQRQFAALQAEVVKARSETERAIRDLKVEKESLSNAKMIISSLERANKSMMEDLRARLHDSQGAVASLLEKSLESEKANAKLRAELDSVRRSHSSLDDEDEIAIGDDDGSFLPPPLLLTETID